MLNNVGSNENDIATDNKSKLKEIENVQPGLALQCNKITECKTLGTHILPMVAYDIEEQLKYITKIISYQFTITDPNNIIHPNHDPFKLTVTIHISPVV